MSVFYKRIKGCEAGANLTKKLWTYLSWGVVKNESDDANNIKYVENMPTLSFSIGKEDDDSSSKRVDFGYLLTNKMPSPTIVNTWEFYGIDILHRETPQDEMQEGLCGGFTGEDTVFNGCQEQAIQLSGNLYVTGHIRNDGDAIIGSKGSSGVFHVWNASSFEERVNIQKTLSVRETVNTGGSIRVKGESSNVEIDGYCEASWFNATSDKRAKENISPAVYNALDLIKNLPIYNFNYKSKPEELVTGILAQDLLKVQPKGLSLVSNVDATGEDGDYMSIKNDKLMFILMKAIQEQQEQIEALKAEIEKLKA